MKSKALKHNCHRYLYKKRLGKTEVKIFYSEFPALSPNFRPLTGYTLSINVLPRCGLCIRVRVRYRVRVHAVAAAVRSSAIWSWNRCRRNTNEEWAHVCAPQAHRKRDAQTKPNTAHRRRQRQRGGVGKGNGNAVAIVVFWFADGWLVVLFVGVLAQSALPFVCSPALACQLFSLSLALLLCCLLTVWLFGFALSWLFARESVSHASSS